MIPIIYDSTETIFSSNGLGRLNDCISAVVTEERNGIYECDFEYPVNGANYNLIQLGRIIGVTHDETGDVQPFDIVSCSRPISGVVTFHAVHISYRQSYLTVTGSGINSLADTFTLFESAKPNNPFTYQSDITKTGYLACADGIPRTVRQMLGGIEGSVLDTFGGEYEWDKFTVKLHSARGKNRDFEIRYGVNMLDFNEEYDSSGTYSSCIPYWTDGTNTIIGDRQEGSALTVTGRGECVPVDVSDKFETAPTKAQVEAMGLSLLNNGHKSVPTQSISVSFVRLQELSEYASYKNLLQCQLCDTVKVIFPNFNSSGQFKIVKTVWDVLAGRFTEMELGMLSVTLAEALGITNSFGQLASSGGSGYSGYGIAVDVTSYTSANPYSVPSDGLFQISCTYRQNSYVQGFVNGTIMIQSSTPSNADLAGNVIMCVPVFKGQDIYATKSSNYSYAYFIPFTGGQ